MKYPQMYDGDWCLPRMSGFYMCCCGCQLVHRLRFKIVQLPSGKSAVVFQACVAKRLTAAERKRVAKKKK